jgi:hypothetical protein
VFVFAGLLGGSSGLEWSWIGTATGGIECGGEFSVGGGFALGGGGRKPTIDTFGLGNPPPLGPTFGAFEEIGSGLTPDGDGGIAPCTGPDGCCEPVGRFSGGSTPADILTPVGRTGYGRNGVSIMTVAAASRDPVFDASAGTRGSLTVPNAAFALWGSWRGGKRAAIKSSAGFGIL